MKRLLQVIYEIIYKDLNLAFKKEYKWLNGWIEGKELKNVLNQLFLRNVYLKKIDLNNIVVTDRIINRVINSRIPLYREAAFLLLKYRKLMNYELEHNEAKELLKNTFIKPEKIEVLFELYWIIKIVKLFKNPQFQLIEYDNNIVAKWIHNNYKYIIYHDSNGIFEFLENTKNLNLNSENKDNYLGRELKVLEKIEQITKIKPDALWGGRPSIILEKYDEDDNLISVFIGEVKHTNDKNYAIKGLKELLEYMALIREKGVYLESYENLFRKLKKVKGGLFLDKINELNFKSNDEIQIIMFGDNLIIDH